MKKIELIILALLVFNIDLLAQSNDGGTKMVAGVFAAIVFYGILALVRGIKARNSNKDEDEL